MIEEKKELKEEFTNEIDGFIQAATGDTESGFRWTRLNAVLVELKRSIKGQRYEDKEFFNYLREDIKDAREIFLEGIKVRNEHVRSNGATPGDYWENMEEEIQSKIAQGS